MNFIIHLQNYYQFYLVLFVCNFGHLTLATDDHDDIDHAFHHGLDSPDHSHNNNNADHNNPSHRAHANHKDRVLLKEVKTLTFYRNKRTTSKRTHSIHQLSCVGGTAGCKLFTPDSVECENLGPSKDDNAKYNWRCRADMSDRVEFKHVEVICEGYDYAEDDYILVGSCGLEFTLDYVDPHDHHHKSYFQHMDEHEKEMHHERIRKKLDKMKAKQASTGTSSLTTSSALLHSLPSVVQDNLMALGLLVILIILIFIVRYLTSSESNDKKSKSKLRSAVNNYGPLTSAVMTKKAC